MFQSDLIFRNPKRPPPEPNLLVIYPSDPPKQGKPCHQQDVRMEGGKGGKGTYPKLLNQLETGRLSYKCHK